MNKIKGPDTKPRSYGSEDCDYSVKSCDSGGKYQELPTIGAFTEVVPGSRSQRLTDNCYCKEDLSKKSGDNIADLLAKKDTGGPPFDNVSRPKRTF